MMVSEKKAITNMRYDKKATKHYGIKLNLKTDADIIAELEKQENLQGYIKRVIRAEIERNRTEQEGE